MEVDGVSGLRLGLLDSGCLKFGSMVAGDAGESAMDQWI